jgi:hypothetical protein
MKKMKNKKAIIIGLIAVVVVAVATAFYFINSNQKAEEAVRNCESFGKADRQWCAEDYIGLTQSNAIEKAEMDGLVPKILRIDGIEQVNTDDGSSPIFFEVENDVVVKAYFEKDRN